MAEHESTRRADPERSVVLEMGMDDSEKMPVVLRPLRSQDDYRQCEDLERQTWGQNFSECVPLSLLMISQKVGGVAAGAFDSDGRMVGMIYGLTGPRQGRLVHWSHMLAVAEDFRGRGLGRELKLYQRQVVRERGVDLMLWTYDPLVARNAHLNIVRLGALPVEYIRDLYGPDTASELHSGMGTDRFVVEWRLEGGPRLDPVAPEDWSAALVLNVADDGSPLESPVEAGDALLARVEIPADIQALKAAEEGAGAEWRASTRGALEASLDEGFEVRGFDRGTLAERSWYLLARRSAA